LANIINIKNEALKQYENFLAKYIKGELDGFFPVRLRYSKPQKTDDRTFIKEKIDYLEKNARNAYGYGCEVEWETTASRTWQEWNIPVNVFIKDQDNYLSYISKENEFLNFVEVSKIICDKLPELKDWLSANPLKVIRYHAIWSELLRVCSYFMNEHRPDRYFIRELPIPNIHTKFIEDNEAIVRELLDYLIPSKIDASVKNFHGRYYVKNKERLVRIRLLCSTLIQGSRYSDFSIRFSDFEKLEISCESIIIAENEMNFLTFPQKAGFIALWNGGGHNIYDLPDVDWLREKRIYYFGDLDVAGFDILSKFRKRYPKTINLMMNKAVFELFYDGGKSIKLIKPQTKGLHAEEVELLNCILPDNLRLEQERIPQVYINQVILAL
jgi:hypothetical protein